MFLMSNILMSLKLRINDNIEQNVKKNFMFHLLWIWKLIIILS